MKVRVGRVEISDVYYTPKHDEERRKILAGGTVFREDHDPGRGLRVCILEHPELEEVELDDKLQLHDPSLAAELPLYDVWVQRDHSHDFKRTFKRRADK